MKNMAELLSVAQFAKLNQEFGDTQWNSPQKINAAIRSMNAPVDTTTDKRMIDPDTWSVWVEENADKLAPKTRGGGSKSSGSASKKAQIRSAVAEKDTVLAYAIPPEKKIAVYGVVDSTSSDGAWLRMDAGRETLFHWETIEEMITKGDMYIGKFGDLLNVMAITANNNGDRETFEVLKKIKEEKYQEQVGSYDLGWREEE